MLRFYNFIQFEFDVVVEFDVIDHVVEFVVSGVESGVESGRRRNTSMINNAVQTPKTNPIA